MYRPYTGLLKRIEIPFQLWVIMTEIRFSNILWVFSFKVSKDEVGLKYSESVEKCFVIYAQPMIFSFLYSSLFCFEHMRGNESFQAKTYIW